MGRRGVSFLLVVGGVGQRGDLLRGTCGRGEAGIDGLECRLVYFCCSSAKELSHCGGSKDEV